ncbi:pimeloyl-ACP methyl ester carboxylesterase [Paenibacillus phyllosphaerae]|uniref:Pimeloyl-ACP methyl ester carboxylesterase n=1 Tax=Paenibacillus phyllosphaerae TaxID=274593 RepID=A0A7W5B0Q4_9BACL|nr:alpha/beta hydrolase [Paenibacillus phyllosphaerae]MBB3112280.1 pimeloyl-ACP methyl ester carboxylesterase [Paenibacillus phyllosphaerae]
MDFQFFTTDDQVKLAYAVQGTGRPIVFVSGYSAAGELWFSQVKACVQAGFQAIVFDRRSHGYSDNPAYGQSMQRHGEDLH